MTENLLKNNLNQEEKKKKSWKLYAATLGIILIGAGTGLGIYYGLHTHHSEVTKINLNTLGLAPTVSQVENDMNQDDVFNKFLDTNKSILDNNLTREQVELSNFSQASILKNGSLTITVKKESNSKYIGSFTFSFKYILSAENIKSVGSFLSEKDLLNLEVPTGTIKSNGSFFSALVKSFRELLSENYEYANGIKDITMTNANKAPNDTQLLDKGYVWKSDNKADITLSINYEDDTHLKIIIENIHYQITMI